MTLANNNKFSSAVASIRLAITKIFQNGASLALAICVAIIFWIAFNVLDQLLFFSPFLDFYLPASAAPNFILSTATSVLMGLVVSINVYIVQSLKLKKNASASLFSGTTLGMISGACASCTSLSFLLISTFGGLGAVASTFLSTFQIPLRLVSIALLVWAIYSSSRRITSSCALPKP
jgi:hypothetical protein